MLNDFDLSQAPKSIDEMLNDIEVEAEFLKSSSTIEIKEDLLLQ